ncbi:MAG: GntR family transcriptional regulator [Deltaproteobacteria bacterium HGW-Deltaproteobacteria-15]|jgi:DNA-binding FadR family transcriptional regulator|nr:MAG: GntR family transcriptional regulator [Deltaproteobacteria bacterium HGW-Deltaproteobacteria-15]
MGGSIQRALDSLRELLENDRFSTGGRLPPERTLAGKLGISRSVLRKALSTLEDEGRIWRHVGRGTFAGTKPQIGQEEFSSVSSVTNPGEIMEARLVLEPKLASMAAVRATMSELAHLETIEMKSREAVNTAAFEHWDGLLHQTIAKATDNSLLISLFVVIHKVRQSDIWGSLKKATLNNEHRKIYLEQHRNLVKALKDRNGPMAEKLMREHLETVRQHLLEVPPLE